MLLSLYKFILAYPTFDSNSLIVGTGSSLFDLTGYLNGQTFTLLYRASRDGYTAAAFHSKCDGKINTLIIIRSNTYGNVFGGYANVAWPTSATATDSNAFIFI